MSPALAHMRRPSFALALLLLPTLLLTGLTSCHGRDTPPPSAATVLVAMQTAMLESAQTLPDGASYTRSAASTDPAYLTDTLLSALYGEAARGVAMAPNDAADTATAPVNDAAIFLSTAPHPCELAVFRCSDARGTATAAKLCRARLEVIRHAWAESAWTSVTEQAVVAVEGSYVLLVVAEDPARVLDGARAAIRS